MEKISIIALAVVMMLLASCGGGKQTTNYQPQQKSQPIERGAEKPKPSAPKLIPVDLPCLDASIDDALYFRDMGIGTAFNQQSAREAAMKSAKAMIRQHLAEYVKGMSTDYSKTLAGGESSYDDVERSMEGVLNNVVESMLNSTERTCEKMLYNEDGQYVSYIAIQISKQEFVNKSAEALSVDEKLRIDFNREQYLKYAEEYMQKMQEAKEKTGY